MNERQFDRYMTRWLERHALKRDVSQLTNRDMRQITGELPVLSIIIPTVRLNPDTGEIENWGTWSADQNFQANVDIDGTMRVNDNVTLNEDLVLETQGAGSVPAAAPAGSVVLYVADDGAGGDCLFLVDDAGDVIELRSADLVLPFELHVGTNIDAGGYIRATGDLESGDDVIVGDDVVLTATGRLWFDVVTNTFITGQANYIVLTVGNTAVWSSGPTYTNYTQKSYFSKMIGMSPITTPGTEANRAWYYGKDVAAKCEAHCMDEDGNETQLSAHDDEGFFMHRSTIPKRNITLQIDIEKFFRDKFPEYIKEQKIKET